MPAVSMADITGTSTDSDVGSVVPDWMDARARRQRWHAPVHLVENQTWKEAFRFGEEMGVGGFASVSRAVHIATGTEVAVKMVIDRTSDDKPTAKSDSVRREIETMRRMDHPAIVSLIEVFSQKPTPQEQDPNAPWVRRWWLILELCRGRDLQHMLLDRGALPLEDAAAIFGQLAVAVEHAHWRGVIHRDIKPGNVMILDPSETGGAKGPKIKLLDFGLAEALDEQFVRFYRKAARKRALREGVSLDPTLTEYDSIHGRTTSKRFTAGLLPSAVMAGQASEYDSASESGGPSLGPSRGTTPVPNQGTPLPQIEERRQRQLRREVFAKGESMSRVGPNLEPTGTQEFAAPEVLAEENYRKKHGTVGGMVDNVVVRTPMVVDSYSMGKLLLYVLTGVPPDQHPGWFVATRRSPLWGMVRGCAGRSPYTARRLEELPDDVRALVNGLTDPSPQTRLTISDLRAHPWVVAAHAPSAV